MIQGAQGSCTGMTPRDGMGREVGGGFGMGNMDLLSHWPLKQWRGECWSTHHWRPLQKWHRACHRLTVRLLLGVTELQSIKDPHLNDITSGTYNIRHNIWEAILSENTAVSLSLFFSWPCHLPGLPSNHTSLPQTVWNSECLSNFAVCN